MVHMRRRDLEILLFHRHRRNEATPSAAPVTKLLDGEVGRKEKAIVWLFCQGIDGAFDVGEPMNGGSDWLKGKLPGKVSKKRT
jgi:hypothetical protein